MAVTWIAPGQFGNAGTGSVSVDVGAVQANDLIFIFVESAAENVAGVVPSGYTSLSYGEVGTSGAAGDGTRITVFWKRATASAAATTVNIGDFGDHTIAVSQIFRGAVTTGNPVQFCEFLPTTKGSASTSYSLTPTNSTTASMTFLVVGTVIPTSISSNYDTSIPTGCSRVTYSNGVAQVTATNTTAGNNGVITAMYFNKTNPGSIGTFTGSYSSTFSKYVGFVIGITPAPRRYPRVVSVTY